MRVKVLGLEHSKRSGIVMNLLMDSPTSIKLNCSKQVWDAGMTANVVDILLLSLKLDDQQAQHEAALRIAYLVGVGDGGVRTLF